MTNLCIFYNIKSQCSRIWNTFIKSSSSIILWFIISIQRFPLKKLILGKSRTSIPIKRGSSEIQSQDIELLKVTGSYFFIRRIFWKRLILKQLLLKIKVYRREGKAFFKFYSQSYFTVPNFITNFQYCFDLN